MAEENGSILTDPAAAAPAAGGEAAPGAGAAGAAAGDTSDWRSGLPEDLRADKSLASFKTTADLAKSYIHAQKMVGGSVRIPGADAKPEEVAAFHKALGVPEAPDKYEVTFVAPDGQTVDQSQLQGFLGKAHAAGMTPKQVQTVLDFYKESFGNAAEAISAKRGETMEALEKEWGGAAARNVAYAQRALAAYDKSGEVRKILDATGLGNSVPMLKLFAQMGADMQEDRIIEGADAGQIEDAKGKLAAIEGGDKKSPYYDRSHPDHKKTVEEALRLRQIIYNSVNA